MPDITIGEFADAIRGEVRAEMRVHRTRMNTQLREFKHEVSGKIDEHNDGQARIAGQVQDVGVQLAELTSAVNLLVEKDAAAAAARARRARAVERTARTARWLFNSAPGIATTVVSAAGVVAGAIALL